MIFLKNKTFLLITLWMYICSIFCIAEANLELRAYNAGQANFIALKHGEHSLVVDCGTQRQELWGNIKDDLSNFLKGTTTSILITHQHADHFAKNKNSTSISLLDIIDNNTIKLNKIIVGGPKKHSNQTLSNISVEQKYRDKFYFYSINKKIYNWAGKLLDDKNDINLIADAFDPDVELKFLLPNDPNEVPPVDNGYYHFQNLILKVSYAGRSMLLPGDANGTLISEIDEDEFKDVDFLMLSHHGSLANGEGDIFKKTPNLSLGIISSTADGYDSLPRLNNKDTLINEFNKDNTCYVKPHSLEFGISKEKGNKLSIKSTQKIDNVQRPLFITSQSNIYYSLSINSVGTMKLCNNKETDPLFISDKKINLSELEDNKIKEYLFLDGLRDTIHQKYNDQDDNKRNTIIEKFNNTIKKGLNSKLTLTPEKLQELSDNILEQNYNDQNICTFLIYLNLFFNDDPMMKHEFKDIHLFSSDDEWHKSRDLLKRLGLIRLGDKYHYWYCRA